MMSCSSPYDYSKQLARDLYKAVCDGDVDRVSALLEQGADPNHQLYWSDEWSGKYPSKYPPLHKACSDGNLKIAQLLVKRDANVNRGDGYYNRTPLHLACYGGHIDTVKYLVDELQCSVGECVDPL